MDQLNFIYHTELFCCFCGDLFSSLFSKYRMGLGWEEAKEKETLTRKGCVIFLFPVCQLYCKLLSLLCYSTTKLIFCKYKMVILGFKRSLSLNLRERDLQFYISAKQNHDVEHEILLRKCWMQKLSEVLCLLLLPLFLMWEG